nr:integrase, catalytic region, zinc finger, CCHC-type, peptidase aspartic, catalytic [Tanacetum cinerariifolium]
MHVVQIVLWYLDSGCSKHMTEDRSQLTNFVNKFLGTFKFGNDHVAKIMGYGDYKIGNVTISRVYFVEELGHNLFSVGQFCDSDLEVAFRQHTCFIRNLGDNESEFVNQTLHEYYEQVGISHETSIAHSPQQNGVVERRNRTLIEAAHTIKNLGKLQPKADIGIFIGYAPTKKAFWIIKTIHVDFDELTTMASEQIISRPALHEMTPVTIMLIPPTPEVIAQIAKVIAPEPAESTGLPSSTTVDQDAPSPSKSKTIPKTQPPVIPHDVVEDNHDIEVVHMGNDPLFGMPIPEVASDQSSSTDSNYTVVHPDHQISQHNNKCTKDHPLENIIGQLARTGSTRLQLHEQALFCYYDAFLTYVKPMMYKDALT